MRSARAGAACEVSSVCVNHSSTRRPAPTLCDTYSLKSQPSQDSTHRPPPPRTHTHTRTPPFERARRRRRAGGLLGELLVTGISLRLREHIYVVFQKHRFHIILQECGTARQHSACSFWRTQRTCTSARCVRYRSIYTDVMCMSSRTSNSTIRWPSFGLAHHLFSGSCL